MKPAPLPTPDADSEPFWAACRAGHLSAQRCPECERFRWPPMEYCPFCHTRGGDWVALPGTGTVSSFVIPHRAFDPAFEDRVPYIIAHIALDGAEGVTIISNVEADPIDSIAVGQRVVVEFVDMGTVTLHRFRLTDPIVSQETKPE
ncbi:MAG TPA: OB-fold domain-containing protein [Devosiaceae bacterium]|jgi:hypothetical protein